MTTTTDINPAEGVNNIVLRLAENENEIIAAQKLRYKVFYEEFNVPAPPHIAADKRDHDAYDLYADHLVVIDTSQSDPEKRIVGTYRLFQADRLPEGIPFYSTQEFDIETLLENGGRVLELGRSCVLPEYRSKYVLQRLWQGIAEYLADHAIDLMFGCASFQGTDVNAIADQLAYLHHYHLAPEAIRPIAKVDCTAGLLMKEKEHLDAKRIFASLPPLVKGYLRAGATVGLGAYLDKEMNCIDVCIVMPTHEVAPKYAKHYDLKIPKKDSE